MNENTIKECTVIAKGNETCPNNAQDKENDIKL